MFGGGGLNFCVVKNKKKSKMLGGGNKAKNMHFFTCPEMHLCEEIELTISKNHRPQPPPTQKNGQSFAIIDLYCQFPLPINWTQLLCSRPIN